MCWLQQSAQLWSYPTFLLIPLMGLALVECFAGFVAWRFLLAANGAVLGFIAGASITMLLGAPMLVVIGALAGGIAGAALFASALPLGSIVVVFGSSASLVVLLCRIAGAPQHTVVPLSALVGSAFAVVAIRRYRPLIISIASIAGAQQLASSWYVYHLPFDSPPMPNAMTPDEFAAFIGLTAVGLIFQFATAPPSRNVSQTDPGQSRGDVVSMESHRCNSRA